MTLTGAMLGMVALCGSEGDILAAQSGGAPAPIEGVWVLNQNLSDSAAGPELRGRSDDRVRDRGNGGFRGPGGIGGGWGGFGGRPGGGGGRETSGRPDLEEMAASREAMQTAEKDLTSAPYRMTIVTPDNEVLLTYGDGRVVRLIPDNREHAGIAGTGMEVRRKTQWVGDRLTTQIELKSRSKLKVQRTYALDSDGQQLVITSRFEGDRVEDDDEREFRRVYDRVPG